MENFFTVFQPLPYSTVAIDMKTLVLLLLYFLCQWASFQLRSTQLLYKAVIATSGHQKESTYDQYRILFSVTINDGIFCLGSHFLSVDCRKPCSSSFSIFSRLFSFSQSSVVFTFLGLPLGKGTTCCSFVSGLKPHQL